MSEKNNEQKSRKPNGGKRLSTVVANGRVPKQKGKPKRLEINSLIFNLQNTFHVTVEIQSVVIGVRHFSISINRRIQRSTSVEAMEMWTWRRMTKISRTERRSNREVLSVEPK